eukprot:TRINITY_DN106684_c0_g1_i1.p1 TRINITY_DN106684_c0_g1~~TRINITY_DN106684_c0_g1_i1.p1  ORF type:complete len:792 (-),score=124.22 TRINITY_DN106684_c0_g1_i1:267-2642(-)
MTENKKPLPLLGLLSGTTWIRDDLMAIFVSRILQEGPDLRSFILKLNGRHRRGFSDAMWRELAQVLQLNAKLRSFTIHFGAYAFNEHQFRDIMRTLERNASLRCFAWCSSRHQRALGDDCLAAAANMLRCNKTLQSFRFDGTAFSVAGLERVLYALHYNKNLRSLHLGCLYRTFSTEEMAILKSLAHVIKENTTLQSFTLHGIWGYGGQVEDAWAEALQSNVQLQSFRFLTNNSHWSHSNRLDHCSVGRVMRRNKDLAVLVRRLAQIAKLSRGTGFRSVTQLQFQRKIMSYFLPPCASIPTNWHMFHCSPKENGTSSAPSCSDVKQSSMGSATLPEHDHPDVWRSTHAILNSEARAPVQKQIDVDENHDEMSKAVEESTAEAFERENSDLSEALMRSKIEALEMTSKPQLSGDGAVLFRLDRHARASEVAHAMLQSSELAPCRDFVSDAGCELQPLWANGAWLLLPFTIQQYEEAREAGALTEFTHCHILLLARDEAAVVQALKSVPKRKRPLLVPVAFNADEVSLKGEGVIEPSITNLTELVDNDSQGGTAKHNDLDVSEDGSCELVVERTFLSWRPVGISEKASAKSAPARLQQAASSVRELRMPASGIDDDAALKLFENTFTSHASGEGSWTIDLSENKLTDAGVDHLLDRLANSQLTCTQLLLHGNPLISQPLSMVTQPSPLSLLVKAGLSVLSISLSISNETFWRILEVCYMRRPRPPFRLYFDAELTAGASKVLQVAQSNGLRMSTVSLEGLPDVGSLASLSAQEDVDVVIFTPQDSRPKSSVLR